MSTWTRRSGRRLRKPLLRRWSLKRSLTRPVPCAHGGARDATLPFLALPLGGAVASVATKPSGTSARPMATVTVEVGLTVSDLGSFAGSKLRCAVSHVGRQFVVGVGEPVDDVLAAPAVDDVALAVGDGGDRVVGAAGHEHVGAGAERRPAAAWSGLRGVDACRRRRRRRCAPAGASSHWKPWNFGLTSGQTGSEGVGRGRRSATKSPLLLVESVTSSARAGDVGQHQGRPRRRLACRRRARGRREGERGEQRARASTSATSRQSIDHP